MSAGEYRRSSEVRCPFGLFPVCHLARSAIEEIDGSGFQAALKHRYRKIDVADHKYSPGGYDQVNLCVPHVHVGDSLR